MARSRRRQQPAKEHPSHLTRAWRWWNGLELQGKLGILGLVVAVVAATPSFIALRSSPPRATTSATTSTRQPSQGPALRLNATYDRDPVSVMWGVPGTLAPDEEPIITAPNLVGNDAAQARIDKLLLQHNGVKIETDQTGNERPHAKLRVVATGQHDPPVLITGLRAAVLRRQPPCTKPSSTPHHKAKARTSRWAWTSMSALPRHAASTTSGASQRPTSPPTTS